MNGAENEPRYGQEDKIKSVEDFDIDQCVSFETREAACVPTAETAVQLFPNIG